MTQAVPLRHFAKELLFFACDSRHFAKAKVLNSIDVGIAGDRLESSLLLLKVFVPTSYSLSPLNCSFVANRRMWTLSTSVVPSGWFAGVFLFSVTVSCPFPSRFFGQSLSCATGGHLLDDVDQYVNWFRTFRCLTVIILVHTERYMLTLTLQWM